MFAIDCQGMELVDRKRSVRSIHVQDVQGNDVGSLRYENIVVSVTDERVRVSHSVPY